MNKVKTIDSKGFSGSNRKFQRFFRPETGDLQKKDLPKNVMKFDVSPQKTQIWASICTPVAPSLLISSGHSPRLGRGTIFVWGVQAVIWGGTAQVCLPVAQGLTGISLKK